MTLEELVHKWFTDHERIVGKLASYAGEPAVFYQTAPADNQAAWKSQYPRIVYAIDMQANQERKSAGTMEISLLCDEAGALPEEIEPAIKECLKDLIIKPDNGSPYCFAWSRTDGFEISSRESGTDTRIIGMEIRFDILEYTSQETTDPDPVVALNKYIKCIIPESFVLWLDHMDSFKVADARIPVFYCQLDAVEKSRETNTVAWMEGRIAVHVLCSSADLRLKWVMALANNLSLDSEVVMLDKSPMRIKRLQVNNKADYLKEGQLIVTVYYGLLRYKNRPHMIVEVGMDFE
jgi:hypothetical protein